jgi:hypothetical protein
MPTPRNEKKAAKAIEAGSFNILAVVAASADS